MRNTHLLLPSQILQLFEACRLPAVHLVKEVVVTMQGLFELVFESTSVGARVGWADLHDHPR